MAKGSNNLRGRTSDASKPYDVSNSFVKRVASRVTELLPQPSSWLSRWMSPSELPSASDFSGLPLSLSSTITTRTPATSRAELNLVDNVDHVPAKRPRTALYSSPVNQNKFLRLNVYSAEDISPIAVRAEPVAGPSSAPPEFIASTPAPTTQQNVPWVPAQPQNVPKVNGDDCSETSESTSGCSSLVPQAQSTTHSLGGNRYGRQLPTGTNADALRRRGPSFSNATFTSPLRVSMRERLGSSPFYSGRTMYGGASQAYMSVIHSPQKRIGPTVKPIPSQQSLPLSSTAKRILDALEQFSTPVIDAKRIPVAVGTKRKMESSGYQRYSELSVPSTPDLLRVKRRERLQQSTSAARQTAATSSQSSPEYSIRKEDTDTRRFTGKVKRKETLEDDVVVEVKLPSAVLPVDNLPKIDIAIPPPSSVQSQLSVPSSGKYSFATPTIVSHSGSVISLPVVIPTSSFKFSSPIVEQSCKTSVSVNANNSLTSLSRTSSDNSSSKNRRRRSSKDESSLSSTDSDNRVSKLHNSTDATPSISNLKHVKTPESKRSYSKIKTPDAPSTSCQKSPTETESDNKVCQTQKSKMVEPIKNNTTSPNQGFGNLYKAQVGTWECSTCMIQNKNNALKCIACESPKPVKKETVSKTPLVNDSTTAGFGEQFKKPSGSWDCQTCLVTNKPDTSKCVACETPKPGDKPPLTSKANNLVESKLPGNNFGDKFKSPPGSWSCETCMITNSAEKEMCAACETPKPGAIPKKLGSTTPQFSFGIPSSTAVSNASSSFSFGINKSEQDNSTKSTSFTLAKTSTENATTATFSFGIPTTKTEKHSVNTNVTTSTSSNLTFQFGSTSSQGKTEPKASQGISEPINIFAKAASERNDISSPEASKSGIPSSNTSSITITPQGNNEGKFNSGLVNENEKSESGSEKSTSGLMFTFGSRATQSTNGKTDSASLLNISKPGFIFETKQRNYGSHIASSTTSTLSTSSSSNIFKFGDTKSVPSGGETSSISSINAQNSFPATKANNVFSLGSNSEKKEINVGLKASQETPKTITTSTATLTMENKSFATFSATTTSQQPVFGNAMTFGSSTFGNKEQNSNTFTPQTTSNLFGATVTTNSSSTSSLPAFGHSNAFQPAVQENKPTSLFSFGPPSKDQSSSGGFVFKPVIDKKPSEPLFAFTSNQPNPPAFGFGSNASPAPSATFNFEAKPFPSTAVPAFNNSPGTVFGTPNSHQPAPAAFGEQQVNPNPVFAFGPRPTQPTEAPTNPIFQFGSGQPSSTPVAPAPAAAFMFGSAPAAPTPAPPPAAPAFDPNIKPTFNFSQGSTPVFSAVPSAPSTPSLPATRKIRKAVRRTNISSNRQT